jgi:succinate-semialdehyde dehydrogenase / glutarate-semialdehyde dehydrogenase
MNERKKISFAHGAELSPDDAPALPLWVDGHAYLLMADRFHDVVDVAGRVLRRVPLYGEDAVAIAAPAAQRAIAGWRATDVLEREVCFRQLDELLARYRGHLARLIAEESGMDHERADAELKDALATIAGVIAGPHERLDPTGRGDVAAVLGDAGSPLAGPLACAVDALAAGWGVVLKPSPRAPSALFACAELFSRAGFPKGIVNCIHGDEDAVKALVAHEDVAALAFVGDGALASRIGVIADAADCTFVAGENRGALESAWRRCLGRPV